MSERVESVQSRGGTVLRGGTVIDVAGERRVDVRLVDGRIAEMHDFVALSNLQRADFDTTKAAQHQASCKTQKPALIGPAARSGRLSFYCLGEHRIGLL